jgi:tetratricopeptide (TPR) repeat protein
MLCHTAEKSFNKGLSLLRRGGDGRECMALFEAALTLDRRAGNGPGQARYRSYYGLCLALRDRKIRDGLLLCRAAAKEEFFNPEMWLNLGRVELAAGNRRHAHKSFRRGLRLAPENDDLRREVTRMGLRRRPAFPFLDRSNPLNVWMGKLAHRSRPAAPAEPRSQVRALR